MALFKVNKFGKCINVSIKFVGGLCFIKITNLAVLEYLTILLIISNCCSVNLYILICAVLGFLHRQEW
jgi:hypothetical protein